MTEEAATPAEETPRPSFAQLASDRFGQQFTGEVPEAPTEAEAPQEPAEQVEAEAPEAEEGEAPEVEAQSEETGEEQGETVEYELSDVAQMLGLDDDAIDVSEDGKVVLKAKVDGETVTLTAQDIVAGIQKHKAADKRLEDAKAHAKKVREDGEKALAQFNEELGIASRLIRKAEATLQADESAIDWKKLRQDDPAEYSAKKHEFDERKRALEAIKTEAREDYQKTLTAHKQKAAQEQEEYLQLEGRALIKAIPEWREAKTAHAEREAIAQYLTQFGFAPNEIEGITDHRQVTLARKAWLYDQSQTKKSAALKKVAKVPKVLKPGNKPPAEQGQKKKLVQAQQRLAKEGTVHAALDVLRAGRK